MESTHPAPHGVRNRKLKDGTAEDRTHEVRCARERKEWQTDPQLMARNAEACYGRSPDRDRIKDRSTLTLDRPNPARDHRRDQGACRRRRVQESQYCWAITEDCQ